MADVPTEVPLDILIPITERAAKLARVHIGVTIPLLTITLIPFFARLYVRVWPVWRFGWDDGLIVAGFACAIVDWALLEGEMFMTPQQITIPQTIAAIRLAYFAIPLWGLTMTLVKTSVALTLLRLPLNHCAWKPMLYSILVAQAVYFIGDTVYIFAKCRPLYGAWDFTQTAFCDCTSVSTDTLVSSIGSAVNVATDILLSLAPMFVLWKLRRPRRERILVCCLTGMGLFASGSSVAKAVMVGKWGYADDPWALAMSIATWNIVEQFVAVLAACSPSLKGPIQRVLGRFGIVLTEYGSHISFVTIPPSREGPPGGGVAARFEAPVHDVEDGPMGRSGPVRFGDGGELGKKTSRVEFSIWRSGDASEASGSGNGHGEEENINIKQA